MILYLWCKCFSSRIKKSCDLWEILRLKLILWQEGTTVLQQDQAYLANMCLPCSWNVDSNLLPPRYLVPKFSSPSDLEVLSNLICAFSCCIPNEWYLSVWKKNACWPLCSHFHSGLLQIHLQLLMSARTTWGFLQHVERCLVPGKLCVLTLLHLCIIFFFLCSCSALHLSLLNEKCILNYGKPPSSLLLVFLVFLSEETRGVRRLLIPGLVPARRVCTRPGVWKVLLIPQV